MKIATAMAFSLPAVLAGPVSASVAAEDPVTNPTQAVLAAEDPVHDMAADAALELERSAGITDSSAPSA